MSFSHIIASIGYSWIINERQPAIRRRRDVAECDFRVESKLFMKNHLTAILAPLRCSMPLSMKFDASVNIDKKQNLLYLVNKSRFTTAVANYT